MLIPDSPVRSLGNIYILGRKKDFQEHILHMYTYKIRTNALEM